MKIESIGISCCHTGVTPSLENVYTDYHVGNIYIFGLNFLDQISHPSSFSGSPSWVFSIINFINYFTPINPLENF